MSLPTTTSNSSLYVTPTSPYCTDIGCVWFDTFYNTLQRTKLAIDEKANILIESLQKSGEIYVTVKNSSGKLKTWCLHLGDKGFIDKDNITFLDSNNRINVIAINDIKELTFPQAHLKEAI